MKTKKIKWSGVTSCLAHKFDTTAKVPDNTPSGVRKVWLLDAQWSTCPIEVYEQVQRLWERNELGNDNYVDKTTIEYLLATGAEVNAIVQYLREMGVGDEDKVFIHYWW
jgi:hypothetical protein